ncbi:MAG: cadherin repeat domain-containing protein, partial [Fusobacterium sp.]
METIAVIQSIDNGAFYIRTSNAHEAEAKVSDKISQDTTISGDPSNTQDSVLALFFNNSKKVIELKGSESITLSDEYIELLELTMDENLLEQSDTKASEEVKDKEKLAKNEEFLKEIENLEETASGENDEGDNTKDLTVSSMNYNSEYSVSSSYGKSNMENLEANLGDSVTTIDPNTQTVNEDIELSISTTNQTEEAVNVNEVIASANAKDLNNDNTDIKYSLDIDHNYLQIDEDSGEVTLTQAGVDAINNDTGIDLTSISFTIIASGSQTQVSSEGSFSISRVNDNEVLIDSVNKNDVLEDGINTNTIVAKVNASDLDDGSLSYSVNGTNASYVSVDSNGEVTLTQAGVDAINSETFNNEDNSFTFSVKISDG